MKSCENCGNFDRTNNKGTEVCGECQTIEPTKWKPTRTNGDRFRELIQSDEGLCDFIFKHNIDESIKFCAAREECREKIERDEFDAFGEDCKRCLMRWLKQPAEVEE